MGKKGGNKRKGQQVVVANVDLGAFQREEQLREQQAADFENKNSLFGVAAVKSLAKIKEEKAKEAQFGEYSVTQQISETDKLAGQNESEKQFSKLCKELDQQKDAKHEHNHWEVASLQKIDNNLVDSVFSNLLTFSEDQQN